MRLRIANTARELYLRSLSLADVEVVGRIAERAFASYEAGDQVRRMTAISLRPEFADTSVELQDNAITPAAYYVLVEQSGIDERVVGLTGLYRRLWDDKGAGNFWLGWFAIDPDRQHEGLGELMLRATLDVCVSIAGRRLSIETSSESHSAKRLYSRLGFALTPVVPDYWSEGSDLVICHKDLGAADVQQPWGDPTNG